MELLLNLIGLVLGIVILVKSADCFTDAAVSVARRLRIPDIIVGATIVSLATTLPEFAVSFTAAWQGKSDMAVGNAVGSTICNVGLILGFCAMISPMGVARKGFVVNGVGLLVLGCAFYVVGLLFPEGSTWMAVVMLSCLVVYLAATLRTALEHRANTAGEEAAPCDLTVPRIVLFFVLGAVGVVGGSRLAVICAEKIALAAGIPRGIIALTLVALGTSMPEFVVSLTAIIKKQRGLSIGNIIGANILNLAWVMGACSLVAKIPFERRNLIFDIPVTLTLSLLLLIFGISGQRLSRWEGAVLFAIYAIYIAISFTVFGAGAPA